MSVVFSKMQGAAILEARVRGLVSHYVVGAISLDEFERSLPDGFALDAAADPRIRRFVLQIMGRIAEYQNGDYDEDVLRDRLAEFERFPVKGRVA